MTAPSPMVLVLLNGLHHPLRQFTDFFLEHPLCLIKASLQGGNFAAACPMPPCIFDVPAITDGSMAKLSDSHVAIAKVRAWASAYA